MSVKEITGLVTLLPDKENTNQSTRTELQAGNVAFRSRTLARTIAFWDTNSGGQNYYMAFYPFKNGGMLEDADITVGHSVFNQADTTAYPAFGVSQQINVFDYSKFRATGTMGTITSTAVSRVYAGVAAYDNTVAASGSFGGDSIVSASDLPADYTQIGIVYAHPAYIASSGTSATLTTAVGLPYVTFTNGGFWDNTFIMPGRWQVLRITTGADAGVYYVEHVDFSTNRLWLRNLNGTPFVGQAAATVAATDIYIGPGRTAFFNEISVIPLSTGTITTGGRFNAGYFAGTTQPIRSSFIVKLKVQKTGSTEAAAAAEQQGSYTLGIKGWTHGDYDHGNGYVFSMYRMTQNEGGATQFVNHTYPYEGAGGGGANAMLLDETNQRLWIGHTNANNDSVILHWRWRTLESPREISNYLGTAVNAGFVTPAITLETGDRIRGGTMDSRQWVYFAIQHPTLGNGGVAIIKPDLTTVQYTESTGGSAFTGTGDTIGGAAPNMTLVDAAATFSAGQVGQSITVASATTGGNNGTFVITGYTSPTQITYQNHAGVAEAFPGTWSVLGVPDSNVAAIVADKTRTRSGTAGDVSTNGADQITSASGGFTASDIGRVIKITGLTGNDNGVFKIATQAGTTATVTTLADAAVTFTTQTGGTFEIGDRLYMFYNNASTGAGAMNYFETLAPGTFLSRTVAMTNGANCNVQTIHGEPQRAAIDPSNGNVYWLSTDTVQQINKYDPAANTHARIAITDTALLSPAGGVAVGAVSPATNPGTPTLFTNILVNSKFDEIWVGSDAGHVKLRKNSFAATDTKRYFGAENTSYSSGTPTTTGAGNGTTGLTYAAPNMTLNAAGTPFVASDVGKWVVITGSSTAANNGIFPITAVNSSSQIVYSNWQSVAFATQANFAGAFHIVPSWAPRSSGGITVWSGGSNVVRGYLEHPDGRVSSRNWAGNTSFGDNYFYSRESDTMVPRVPTYGSQGGASGRNFAIDSVGWFLDFCYNAGNAGTRMQLGSVEIDYQWNGAAWVPKELAYEGTPNKDTSDTTSPLCAAKPIHSTLDDLIYGVKVQFNRQGGATPNNNEFLGRMGQTRITTTDGATTTGAATFNGSGFVASDAGRLLRIESGVDAGVYKINTFVNAGQLTLKTLANLTFAAAATAGTLTYSIWDAGSAGSNAGPEVMTFILADGVSKDNTQDITGFTYEAYHFKTRMHENDESRKFCVENPFPASGGLATKGYFENYGRQTAQYDAGTAHHLALPAAEFANGRQAFDGIIGKFMDGVGGHGLMYSNQGTTTAWAGINADSSLLGWALTVDFGADVQVGYAILRAHAFGVQRLMATTSHNGLRAGIYKANSAAGIPAGSVTARGVGNGSSGIAGTAPAMTLNSTLTPFTAGDVGKYVIITGASNAANNGIFTITAFNSASSISYTNASGVAQANYAATWYVVPTANVRTSGSVNFTVGTANTTTATATSGDFLGPISLTPVTPAVGAITAGLNTFSDTTNTPFLAAHVGQVLKVTAGAGADISSYRILSVESSSSITIRNLDQTSKSWTVSSSTVTYEVRDAVREEDMLLVQGHRLCVERLLTTTTLGVRTGPNAIVTTQNWVCVKPPWSLVKKISHDTEAVPPDVKNNKTWVSADGRNVYDLADAIIYADFTDLASAERTGRYWKFTAIPRFDTDGVRSDHDISTWEFYDIAGNRLGTSKYTLVDEARTNADFLFTHVNRVDFIQAANDATAGIAGTNGNVNLGGSNGDTLTLTTGGNKFLGFQIGAPRADGNLPVGTNIINSASSSWGATVMVGRFIRITSGTNAGNFYRVASRSSATQITVVTPSGTAVSWAGTESSITFTVHEGINAGGTAPDKFVFLADQREFTLATINDALTTLTFNESLQPVRTNQVWEIRRPGYDTASATTEGTKTARLTRPGTTYPLQTGDLCHDSLGAYRFLSEDIGTGFQRTDGSIAGGSGVITGSGFSPDDVGRLLYVISGTATQANIGVYEISVYTSDTQVTVKNHYTGAAVSFTADAAASSTTYQVYGDRRFKLTRFVVGLRA